MRRAGYVIGIVGVFVAGLLSDGDWLPLVLAFVSGAVYGWSILLSSAERFGRGAPRDR